MGTDLNLSSVGARERTPSRKALDLLPKSQQLARGFKADEARLAA